MKNFLAGFLRVPFIAIGPFVPTSVIRSLKNVELAMPGGGTLDLSAAL